MLVLVVVIAAMVAVTLRTRSANQAEISAVDRLWSASQGLKGAVVDQETAVRGFALTGDAAYLEPYQAGVDRTAVLLQRLAAAFEGDRAGLRAVEQARERILRWRRDVAVPEIAAVTAGDRAAAVEIEASGVGREHFDRIRASLTDVVDRVNDDRQDRLEGINRSTTTSLLLAMGLAAFTVVSGALLWRVARRWSREHTADVADEERRALAEERERQWIVSVAELSERLNHAESLDAVAALVADHAAIPVGGRYVHLGLVDREGDLRMIYDRAFASIEAAPSVRHRGERTPLVEAVRTRSTIVIGSGPGAVPMDAVPDFADLAVRAGIASITASPLMQGNGQIIGALGIFWTEDVAIDTLMRSRLDELTALATEALRRARLYDTSTQLADVSRLLSRAMTDDEVGRIVADQGAGVFDAKVSNLAVLQRDRTTVHLYHHRRGDEEGEQLHDSELPLGIASPLTDAIAMQRPVVLETLEPYAARNELAHQHMVGLGLQSSITMPVTVRGVVVASIGFGWARPQFADDIAAPLGTLVELVSAALHRSAVFHASSRVATFAEQLATAPSEPDIARALFEVVVPDVLGAVAGRLGVLDEENGQITVLHPDDTPAPVAETLTALPLNADTPLAEAIRTGAEVVLTDPEAIRMRWPHLVVGAEEPPTRITATPLHDSADHVIGAVAVAWRGELELDPMSRTLFDTVIDLCGATLERTRLQDLEHQLITHLARYFSPPLVALDGFETAGRYQPALSDIGMGGDWYDLVELERGRVGAVVGDVVGHGVSAVAEMARLKTTLATLVAMGVGVDALFPLAHRIIGGADTFRGTALYAELDPDTATLRVSSAGHPPPIVRTADGEVHVVADASRYPVLGITPQGTTSSTPSAFGPGDTFIAYTDGLVERRGEVLDEGIEQLAHLVGELGDRPVDDVADAIVGRLGPGGADDVALLVIRNAS